MRAISGVLLVLSLEINLIICARILGVFTYPSKSHQILGGALLKELAHRGHDVTMFSTNRQDDPPENYTDIVLKGANELLDYRMKVLSNPNATFFEKLCFIVSSLEVINTHVYESEEFHRVVNMEKKFDLIIHQWVSNEAMLIIGHKHKAPTIGFSVVGGSNFISGYYNNPTPYAYVPNLLMPFTDKMTFPQRVINTILGVIFDGLFYFYNLRVQTNLLNKHFPEAPNIEELISSVDITLLNSHIVLESLRPYLPNLIQIGGFHLYENETIPGDILKFLDESNEGVIYFNLGSNIKSTSILPETLDVFKQSLSKIRYRVLWKFDGDWNDKPKHILISKWLPQRAILSHKNIKAFITHGGLGGTVEAIFHGVPMIGIPFFGDQEKNVADFVGKGCGIKLDIKGLTEKIFTDAINELLTNEKYFNSMQLLSDIYRNQEVNPMDKAVFWVEHVLKHKGAKHMRSIVCDMPWYKYMLVDVVAFIGLVVIVMFYLVYLLFKLIMYFCRKMYSSRKEKLL